MSASFTATLVACSLDRSVSASDAFMTENMPIITSGTNNNDNSSQCES